MVQIIQNVVDMGGLFWQVAGTDPISAALLVVGAAFIGFSSLVFGGLTAGALIDLVVPESLKTEPADSSH